MTLTHSQIERDIAAHIPVGIDPDIAWIIATGEEEQRIVQYLYANAVVVAHNEGEGFGPVTLIVVCGRPGRSDAERLANEQVARMGSGLITAQVYRTYASAHAGALRFHAGGVL